MGNYECRIATVDEIEKKFDYAISKATNDKYNWIIWKREAIEEFYKNSTTAYFGFLDDDIVSICFAATGTVNVQNVDGLVDDETAYLFGFKTKDEHQGKGYFSKLFKTMINDLKSRGYKKVTLGVEKDNYKNKAIYSKYGFNTYIKDGKEVYPDGTIIDVEFYSKNLI